MDWFRAIVFLCLALWTTTVVSSSSSQQDKCDYKIHYNTLMNVTQSTERGATIIPFTSVHVTSSEECGHHCCNKLNETCNVAEYDPNITDEANCLLFYCNPISSCTFSHSDTVHLVNVYRPTTYEPSSPETTTSMQPTTVAQTKSQFPEPSVLGEPSTSSKPSNLAKGRTNEINKLPPIDKIKPVTTEMPTSSMSHDLTAQSANISELQEIFVEMPQGDSSASKGNGAEKIDVSTSLDADKNRLSTGKKGVGVEEPKNKNSSATPMSVSNEIAEDKSKNSSIETVVVATVKTFATVDNEETPTATQPEAITATDTATIAIEQSTPQVPTSLSTSQEIPQSPTTAPLPTASATQPSDNSTTVSDIVALVNTSVPESTYTSQNSTEVGQEEDSTSDIDDFKVRAKFHLVFALVLGLMLLITVMGLVLRRVYDVWMRRHYQRMDFLVDGMYNSVNS